MQGGIALPSPPCNTKQTCGLTEEGPVRLSNELRNGCRKGGVEKNKKKPQRYIPDYTQRNARIRSLYYARVSGRKVPFSTPEGPTQRTAKETVKPT